MVLILTKKKNSLTSENVKYLNDSCKLKYLINDNYVIIIDDLKVEEDGFIKSINLFFEEILVTLNIESIITTKCSKKLQEIAMNYNIPLIEIG